MTPCPRAFSSDHPPQQMGQFKTALANVSIRCRTQSPWHFGRSGARRTRRPGSTAAARVSAVPRAIRMGFTNPASVVASKALYRLTHSCPSNESPRRNSRSAGGLYRTLSGPSLLIPASQEVPWGRSDFCADPTLFSALIIVASRSN
jgi:hypothetical protein